MFIVLLLHQNTVCLVYIGKYRVELPLERVRLKMEMPVRMEFFCNPVIGTLYLIRSGIPADVEYAIITK